MLDRDLSQKIEEIIKVDQANEQAVYTEITEYVVTDRIRGQYYEILRAIADAPSDPHEGIGVWVSGFFGSGKSSFVKNIGYVLANRTVLSQPASELFEAQVSDKHISELVDFISELVAENALLRQQLIILKRQVKRPTFTRTDRILLVVLARLVRTWQQALEIVQPDTRLALASGALSLVLEA